MASSMELSGSESEVFYDAVEELDGDPPQDAHDHPDGANFRTVNVVQNETSFSGKKMVDEEEKMTSRDDEVRNDRREEDGERKVNATVEDSAININADDNEGSDKHSNNGNETLADHSYDNISNSTSAHYAHDDECSSSYSEDKEGIDQAKTEAVIEDSLPTSIHTIATPSNNENDHTNPEPSSIPSSSLSPSSPSSPSPAPPSPSSPPSSSPPPSSPPPSSPPPSSPPPSSPSPPPSSLTSMPLEVPTKEELRQRAEQEKLLGNDAFGRGDLDEAEAHYFQALHLAPPEYFVERSVYLNNAAACFFRKNQFAYCAQYATAALDLNPSYSKALARRCSAFEKLDELDRALTDAKAILELQPNDTWAKKVVERVEPMVAEKQEKLKEEMISKLKDLGNTVLGKFGLSLDNFKADKDPETGGYSLRFQR